jgi:hypothetical protein
MVTIDIPLEDEQVDAAPLTSDLEPTSVESEEV